MRELQSSLTVVRNRNRGSTIHVKDCLPFDISHPSIVGTTSKVAVTHVRELLLFEHPLDRRAPPGVSGSSCCPFGRPFLKHGGQFL